MHLRSLFTKSNPLANASKRLQLNEPLPEIRSCLKNGNKGTGKSVHFPVVICHQWTTKNYSDCEDFKTWWTNKEEVPLSNFRDKAILDSESTARDYVLAYNVAYLQMSDFDEVDLDIQLALVRGIVSDYCTLERFSADRRRRHEYAKLVRKSILVHCSLLKSEGRDDWDTQLSLHCENLSLGHQQWAGFMGYIQNVAVRVDSALEPTVSRPAVHVAERVQQERQKRKIHWRPLKRRTRSATEEHTPTAIMI